MAFTRTNSKALYGNLLTLPVGGGLLYVQPLYATKEAATGSYPVLKFVLVALGDKSGIGTTLEQAIFDVLQYSPTDPVTPPDDGGDGGPQQPTGTRAVQIQKLLSQANALFTEADNALRAGNLEEYAAKVEAARLKIDQALRLATATRAQ